jgi:CRP/FNR family cyclic AMP-dependent transcriptional regulator
VFLSAHSLCVAAGYCYPPVKIARRQTIHIEGLALEGLTRRLRPSEVIFSRGEDADSLMYVLNGRITLSSSGSGDLIVTILGSGDCFGEEVLAGHVTRTRTATAMTSGTVIVISRAAMTKLVRTQPLRAHRFMAYVLSQHIRVEADLTALLHSSAEQRLARTLLTLAGYGHHKTRKHIVPRMSQTILANIVGSTRSRINMFLQKFERLGFIQRNGFLVVRRSLRSVLLRPPN